MPKFKQITVAVLLTAAAGTACGSDELSLTSSCGEYFELDQADRHDAAQRLSIEAQVDSPGGPMWGLNVDSACGSLGNDAQVRQAFGLEPVDEDDREGDDTGEGPDPIALERLERAAEGLPSCRLFTPRDYFAMFDSLPSEITTSGNSNLACEYRNGGVGVPALSIGKDCPRAKMPRSGPASQTMTPIERFKDNYPERASVGPQGTSTNEFGSLALIRGDCVIRVSAPEMDENTVADILKLAAERAS